MYFKRLSCSNFFPLKAWSWWEFCLLGRTLFLRALLSRFGSSLSHHILKVCISASHQTGKETQVQRSWSGSGKKYYSFCCQGWRSLKLRHPQKKQTFWTRRQPWSWNIWNWSTNFLVGPLFRKLRFENHTLQPFTSSTPLNSVCSRLRHFSSTLACSPCLDLWWQSWSVMLLKFGTLGMFYGKGLRRHEFPESCSLDACFRCRHRGRLDVRWVVGSLSSQ